MCLDVKIKKQDRVTYPKVRLYNHRQQPFIVGVSSYRDMIKKAGFPAIYKKIYKLAKKYKRIAKRDITCYKIMQSDAKSVHVGFQYELGYEYYRTEGYDKFGYSYYNKGEYLSINEGFHSFSKKPTLYLINHSFLSTAVYECTIPKGAEYFCAHGQYCSDRIIINKKL